jgi:hypothetical protein
MVSRGSRSVFRLLAGWLGWWVILAAWKLGPAIPALLRVSQEGAKGSANVSFGDGGFSATISEGTTIAWEGHISFIKLVLLVGLPPLVLWVVWLRTGRRPDAPDLIGEGAAEASPGSDRVHDREARH